VDGRVGIDTIATGEDGVITPLGVTVDEHGNVYVSVKSLPLGPPDSGPPPATGEILRFSGLWPSAALSAYVSGS
jgi:hypothetical protein